MISHFERDKPTGRSETESGQCIKGVHNNGFIGMFSAANATKNENTLPSPVDELVDIQLDDCDMFADPVALIGEWNNDDFWLSPSSPVSPRETWSTSQVRGVAVISPPMVDSVFVSSGQSIADLMSAHYPSLDMVGAEQQVVSPTSGDVQSIADRFNSMIRNSFVENGTSLQAPISTFHSSATHRTNMFNMTNQCQTPAVSSPPRNGSWLVQQIVEQPHMMRRTRAYAMALQDCVVPSSTTARRVDASMESFRMAANDSTVNWHNGRGEKAAFLSENNLVPLLTSRQIERNECNLESPSPPLVPSSSRVERRTLPRNYTSSLPPVVRPLTAYNFFFRFERDRLVKFCTEYGHCGTDGNLEAAINHMPAEYCKHYQLTPENSAAFQTKLLHEQWSRDPTVKRRHIKSHGKISFYTLTQCISQSWKALPSAVRDVFRGIALQDAERYRREMKQEVQLAHKRRKVSV